MFFKDDAKFSDAASLSDNFVRNGAIIGERANRIETGTFFDRFTEHRVEINGVEGIILANFEKIEAIGVKNFNSAHRF